MDQARFENAVLMRDSGHVQDAIREFHSMAADSRDVNERCSLLINEPRGYSMMRRRKDAKRILRQIQIAGTRRHDCTR